MKSSYLRAVVETAVDGVILIDPHGKVLLFNPACERIFGYSAEEIVGGDVKRLMPQPYQGEHDQYLANYQATRERKIIGIGRQVLGRRKSGETFPMDLSVGEVEGAEEAAYVGILRDVTERVRESEQRELLIEQLVKSNAEQTHFVHAVSHDLREPLRMINAFAGRLAGKYSEQLDALGKEWLALVTDASLRMNAQLDDLVEFARLSNDAEQGKIVDAGRIVDNVVESLSKAIERAGGEVTHGPLPQLVVNPMRFERLMQNLIGNALKYVARDVSPRVRVEAAREGDFWRVSVADNGIGIDPRHFQRIFEPFKRLHGHGQYEGTGLGLSICRKIAEGFGGVISVQSSEGQGSAFSFTIPINQQRAATSEHDD